MNSLLKRAPAPLIVILSSAIAHGAETPTTTKTEPIPTEYSQLEKEKSHYTLFHPTPKRLMREFNTDRPDKTESPYTVDAGHFQYEADLAHYAVHRAEDGTLSQTWAFNTMNLKVGLTNRSDFQVVVPTYNTLSVSSAPWGYHGYADTFLRFKYNFFGNEGGAIAFGVMPYIKIPTAVDGLGNKRTEGGVIFPFALALPEDWTSGFMFVFSKDRNQANGGYHSEFISTWTLHHPIPAQIDGFIEIFSRSSNEVGSSWEATFDVGFVYPLASNIKVDTGIYFGLTPAADDYSPFVGISFRL
jgi:hypothetical protein